MHAFRTAVDARDFAAISALLADDVVLRSPVAHKPYAGRAIVEAILRNVIEVLEGFTYVRAIGAEDDADTALVFTAAVGGRELTGCDFLQRGADGRISEIMVMVRPLSAAQALAQAMEARFDRVLDEARAAQA